jgi:phospholipid/cholesterol/gamma-HCH transport system ATP-binding protein
MGTDAAVRFIEAGLPPVLDGASHAFGKGTISEVITEGEDECALLVKILTGLCPLHRGKIVVLTHDLRSLSRDELDGVRRRLGIVYPNGGLISNLKVLENVTLPLLYRSAESGVEIEKRAVASLDRFGGREDFFKLPSGLSPFKRRMAGFARVIALEPEVVVYDRLTDGLHAEGRDLLLGAARAFHSEKPGRTTIFLSHRSRSIDGDGAVAIVHLTKGRFV